MNPWDLTSSELLVWGIVLHLIADWPLQNDWMANNKARRYRPRWQVFDGDRWSVESRWWDRHPAAYVHAGIHGLLLAAVFGWIAVPLAVVHLLIDLRTPVAWWSRRVGQTQPVGHEITVQEQGLAFGLTESGLRDRQRATLYDIGTEVRFWTDQVFHIACIAVAALLVAT